MFAYLIETWSFFWGGDSLCVRCVGGGLGGGKSQSFMYIACLYLRWNTYAQPELMMGNEISDYCFATKHMITQCSPSSQSRDELAVNMIPPPQKKKEKNISMPSLSLSP